MADESKAAVDGDLSSTLTADTIPPNFLPLFSSCRLLPALATVMSIFREGLFKGKVAIVTGKWWTGTNAHRY